MPSAHRLSNRTSLRLKELAGEKRICALLEAIKNSISLTETGILAAERAKNVVSAHDDMILSVREAERKQHNFSFGSIAPAPIWNLTPILSEIFPGKTVSSDLRETELIQGLDDGTYNLIVLLRPIEKKYRRKGALQKHSPYKRKPFRAFAVRSPLFKPDFPAPKRPCRRWRTSLFSFIQSPVLFFNAPCVIADTFNFAASIFSFRHSVFSPIFLTKQPQRAAWLKVK